jgi:hypothetical protein
MNVFLFFKKVMTPSQHHTVHLGLLKEQERRRDLFQ